ncbi:protein of unknown function [Pseudomonas marincola]|uniref:Uncharacterized protein n=1 Tax=Pseudomonas marincola TaxID=437900 RepID=A0A8S2BHT9_9PSED|nr:protein of unknown function [Pseudomonas marincola]
MIFLDPTLFILTKKEQKNYETAFTNACSGCYPSILPR